MKDYTNDAMGGSKKLSDSVLCVTSFIQIGQRVEPPRNAHRRPIFFMGVLAWWVSVGAGSADDSILSKNLTHNIEASAQRFVKASYVFT